MTQDNCTWLTQVCQAINSTGVRTFYKDVIYITSGLSTTLLIVWMCTVNIIEGMSDIV